MRLSPLTGIGCTILIAVATTGCGSDEKPKPEPKPEPTRVEVTISAQEDVNPDANGSPSLIVARLFILRGQSAFATPDFFALWNSEQAVLARDLLSREELVLKPGQTTTLQNVVDAEARVLGVAAAYQDIDRATWRAWAPLTEGQVNAYKIELASRAVSLKAVPKKDEPEKPAKDKNEKKEKKEGGT